MLVISVGTVDFSVIVMFEFAESWAYPIIYEA